MSIIDEARAYLQSLRRPSLSPEDEDRIARTAIGEAGAESDEGVAAVIHAIKNRLGSGRFGASVQDVTRPSQFNAWADPKGPAATTPPQSPGYQRAVGLVKQVFAGEMPDPTGGATHFYSPANMPGGKEPSWAPELTPVAEIGGHRFFREGKPTQVAADTGPKDVVTEAREYLRSLGAEGNPVPPSGDSPRLTDLPDNSRTPDGSLVVRIPATPPTAAREPPAPLSDDEVKKFVDYHLTTGKTDSQIARSIAEYYQKDYDALRKEGHSNSDIISGLTNLKHPGAWGAAGVSALRGFAQALPAGAGFAGGALVGAKLAAPFTPVFPPAPAVGALFGGLTAGAAGMLAGNEAASWFPQTNDLVPEDRKWDVSGETVGQGLGAAPTLFGIGRTAPTTGVKLLDKGMQAVANLGQQARKAPLRYLSQEAAIAAGAGAGAGAAEAVDPGDPITRLVGELVGGTTTAVRGLLTPNLLKGAKSAVSGAAPERRKGAAAEFLRKAIIEHGEDPEAIRAALLQADNQFTVSTPAQITGSPALIKLENYLGSLSDEFGEEVGRRARESLKESRLLINALFEMGDPEALAAAAKAQTDHFKRLIQAPVAKAQQDAVEAARKISDGISPDMQGVYLSRISQREHAAIVKAAEEARDIEEAVWNSIPNNVPGGATNLLRTVQDQWSTRSLPVPEGQKLAPAQLDQWVKGLLEDVNMFGPITSGQLKTARRLIGNKINDLDVPGGDTDAVGKLRHLYAAVVRDMEAIPEIATELTIATAYSKAKSEAFREALVGDFALSGRRGSAEAIEPELLLRAGITGNQEKRGLSFQQLQGMGDFPREQLSRAEVYRQAGIPLQSLDRNNPAVVRKAQEDYLRALAGETVTDGVVDEAAVNRFLTSNREALDAFPELRAQLQDAGQRSALLIEKQAQMKRTGDHLADRNVITFARLTEHLDPILTIEQAVNSTDPVKNLQRIFAVAKRGIPGEPGSAEAAIAGARTTLLQYAERKATAKASGGDPYLHSLREALDGGIQGLPKSRVPSLLQIAVREGIVDRPTAERFHKLLAQVDNVEKSITTKDKLRPGSFGVTTFIEDLSVRAAGSHLGTMIASIAGHPLVMASAGVRGMKLFDAAQQMSIPNLLMEASRDPKVFAALLARPKNEAEKFRLAHNLDAWVAATFPSLFVSDSWEAPQ